MNLNNLNNFLRIFFLIILSCCLASCNKSEQQQSQAKVKRELIRKSPIEVLIAKAEAGNSKAELELTDKYSQGEELPQDFEKAKYWLNKSATHNNAFAKFNLASRYELDGSEEEKLSSKQLFKEAYVEFKKTSNHDLDAKFKLALMTLSGNSCDKDEVLGLKLMKEAADSGNSVASFELWEIYMTALYGFKQDVKEAVKWLKQSANQGYARAQDELAGNTMLG